MSIDVFEGIFEQNRNLRLPPIMSDGDNVPNGFEGPARLDMLFRIALYFAFVLIAAPIDSVLYVWSGWVHENDEEMLKPFRDALLYTYMFVLSVETMFRIEQNHDVLVNKSWLRIPQGVAFLLVLLFIIDYMNVVRPIVLKGESAIDSTYRQELCSIIAIIASFLSFVACETEKKAGITVPALKAKGTEDSKEK